VIEAKTSPATGLTGLLVNKKARLSARVRDLPKVVLANHGIELGPIAWVKRPKGLLGAVDALLERGVDRLIVGGGDGTLSTVAARLAHRNVTLGVLPLGTANDFARTLGIPSDLDAAAAIIASGHVRLVDLGLANDAYFLNVASLGMSVSATSQLSPEMKRWFGSFAYFYAGARAFTLHPTFHLRVQNGPDSVETTAHQLVVGNGRFYGGGVLVARQSSLEDGMLHAYALGTRGRWDLLRTIALLRMGVPIDRPGDCFLRTAALEVETWPTLAVNCDGEIRTRTPVKFTVEPKALRVLAPLVGLG
jgi:YegS/Rv2252/BmrU family lipid kinase